MGKRGKASRQVGTYVPGEARKALENGRGEPKFRAARHCESCGGTGLVPNSIDNTRKFCNCRYDFAVENEPPKNRPHSLTYFAPTMIKTRISADSTRRYWEDVNKGNW